MRSPGDPLRGILIAAGVLGALGVALGAFGAHGLEGRVPAGRLATFETGVRYHLVHAVALLALFGAGGRIGVSGARRVATAWILGVAVFSGSLYLLVLLDLPILGAVTPLGGILLIAGWVLAAASRTGGPAEHRDWPGGFERVD